MSQYHRLNVNEREEISLGIAQGRSQYDIAILLSRSPSIICHEINRNTKTKQRDGSLFDKTLSALQAINGGIDMLRVARIKSKNKIYHIIIRGINQQNIFSADEDYEKGKMGSGFTTSHFIFLFLFYIL